MEEKVCKLNLGGLDCASCANKIEDSLTKSGFENVNVNFLTKELTVKGDVEKAKKIIKNVEPGIKVTVKNNLDNDEQSNKDFTLYSISVSIILFLVGSYLFYMNNYSKFIVIPILTISYLIAGYKVLKTAILNILKGNIFDENFLMTVATLGAFALGEYPEAAGVMIFFMVGEYFQNLAVNKSRNRVKSLLKLKPEFANLEKDGTILKVKPDKLSLNDIVVVKPGEKVPVDGVVVFGKSTLNVSALTGESIPKSINNGEIALSGSININGLIKIKVTKTYKNSTISKIMEMVENAISKKAKTEQFITKFAKYYTPLVVVTAGLIAFVTPVILGQPFNIWISRALVLLVISCPCALVLSIPLGYFGGIGKSAKNGILIKGSNFLDLLGNLHSIALDKTGTITKGVFEVSKIIMANNITSEELLKLAALAEINSNHPIAKAIVKKYSKKIDGNAVKHFEEISGFGIKAETINGEIIAGNDKLLHKFNIEHTTCHTDGTVVHIALNREYKGYIIISDTLKRDSKEAITNLKEIGIKNIAMVTGDSIDVANTVAKQVGIENVYANLLPEGKVQVLKNLKKLAEKENGSVAFVGDGINDAPVLALADIGIAMGGLGSDIAIETADIVIMNDSLLKLTEGIKTAKFTKKVVMQNIVLALTVKFLFIALGIFGEATMWEAVFADVGVALLAVFNSMRILK